MAPRLKHTSHNTGPCDFGADLNQQNTEVVKNAK